MIDKKPFGRTGQMSSRVIFGGAALWDVTQQESDEVLALLQEYGINHIDTAPTYGDSELHIGPWMEKHREDFFLATKVDLRTYDEAWGQIRASLDRLRVDQLDLIQLHNLIEPDEWEVAMGSDGSLKAVIEAREQGITRFIGVTGHGATAATMHKKSLERFDFDSVLITYSHILMQDPNTAAEFDSMMAMCKEREIAVQTIKSVTRRPWGDREKTHTTWYEPFEDQESIDKVVHWVLGNPDVFLVSTGDTHILPKVLDSAFRFESRPSEEEMQSLLTEQKMEPLFE
ncbi:MAG: aldo/keto reductase [Anaerolineales bacterium]|nr:aldo/keto reductase [Anaerolineales bacterium]